MDLENKIDNYAEVGEAWLKVAELVKYEKYRPALVGRSAFYFRLAMLQSKHLANLKYGQVLSASRSAHVILKRNSNQPPSHKSKTTDMEFIRVEPGVFMIGSNEKKYRTTISRPFYIGKLEVTQKQSENRDGRRPLDKEKECRKKCKYALRRYLSRELSHVGKRRAKLFGLALAINTLPELKPQPKTWTAIAGLSLTELRQNGNIMGWQSFVLLESHNRISALQRRGEFGSASDGLIDCAKQHCWVRSTRTWNRSQRYFHIKLGRRLG